MKSNFPCKEHGEPVQEICLSCKEPVCYKCNATHIAKQHVTGMDLPSYAKTSIMPRYTAMLLDLEKKKDMIGKNSKEFTAFLPKVKEGLVALKEKMERLLDQVNKVIETLKGFKEEPQSIYENMKASLEQGQKDLQDAISNEDMKFIVGALNTPEALNVPGVGDSDNRCIEVVSKTVSLLAQSKEFDALNDGITALIDACKKVIKPICYIMPVMSKYVYGICSQQGFNKLCRFDIKTNKLAAIMNVPSYCSVLQIEKQIFIIGGTSPDVNTLSEFDENTLSLVAKAPMNYAKSWFKSIAISSANFVTIGGWHSTNGNLSYCEEYSISENKWTLLPSLKQVRYSAAVSLQNNTDLYAIGGRDASTIEKLDLKEKKEWITINLAFNEINLCGYISAFALSPDEIIVFPQGATDTGIYSIKYNTIRKHSLVSKAGNYSNNTARNIGGIVYTLIDNPGDIIMYNPAEKKLDILDYNKIYP